MKFDTPATNPFLSGQDKSRMAVPGLSLMWETPSPDIAGNAQNESPRPLRGGRIVALPDERPNVWPRKPTRIACMVQRSADDVGQTDQPLDAQDQDDNQTDLQGGRRGDDQLA